MVSQYIIIPLACQILAIIFSPTGLAVSPQCSSNYVNNPQCGIQFTSAESFSLTTTGYTYNVPEAQQQCSNMTVNGISFGSGFTGNIAQFAGAASKIPFIGTGVADFIDFFVGLGQQTRANVLQTQANNYFIQNTASGINIGDTSQIGTAQYIVPINSSLGQQRLAAYNSLQNQIGNTNTLVNACKKASGNILTITFDAQDISTLFIGAVITAGAVASLTSIVLNAGGTFTVFTIASLGLIWLILSALAFPTWAIIPRPFGSSLYALVTLGFALGMIGELGSIAA